MSPRGVPKDKTPAVVEEQSVEVVGEVPEEDFPDGREWDAAEAKSLQEFNEHIQSLVKNFVEQEISGLDERLRDLERLMTIVIGKTGAANDDASAAPYKPAEVGEPHYDVPDYKQEHQGGDGIGWYTG